MIDEFLGSNLSRDVRVECRPIRQSQDFASVWILHHNSAGFSMSFLDRSIQFALGDVLDLLVDGQNNIVARVRLDF